MPMNCRTIEFGLINCHKKRLIKNAKKARLYSEQKNDMFDWRAARRLRRYEIDHYKGPVQYIMQHEVMREDHVTTPCRIVFNTS